MKTCSLCGVAKSVSEFHRNGVSKGKPRLRSCCKVCSKPIDRKKAAASKSIYRQAKLDALKEGCTDCKNTDIRVLEFDHRPGVEKLFDIGGDPKGLNKLLEEIAKCDVVCANCHRIRTIERGQHWKSVTVQMEGNPGRSPGNDC